MIRTITPMAMAWFARSTPTAMIPTGTAMAVTTMFPRSTTPMTQTMIRTTTGLRNIHIGAILLGAIRPGGEMLGTRGVGAPTLVTIVIVTITRAGGEMLGT